jgi:hypothetical protein
MDPATKTTDALLDTDEITIEAWVRSTGLQGTNLNPAEIADAARGGARNFSLFQVGDAFGGHADFVGYQLTAPGSVVPGKLQHVVYTNSVATGTHNLYIDDEQKASAATNLGSLKFLPDIPLSLANRSAAIHPWLGEIHLLAIYDRALSFAEIDQNYLARPKTASMPVAPSRPEPTTFSLPPATVKNLVIIAHGRDTSIETFNNGWVRGMERDIEQWIDRQGNADEWAVISYDWTADSMADDYYLKAIAHGTALGTTLASLGYEHIHLVGHSAGAALITSVAEEIQLRSSATDTHLTYLDAYVPLPAYAEWFGTVAAQATWAEQYLDQGFPSGFPPRTRVQIPHVHNVDVTDLRPNGVDSHSWPHLFYRDTATTEVNDRDAHWGPYGFVLSREASLVAYDDWNPAQQFPPNAPAPVLLRKSDAANFAQLGTVTNGSVAFNGTRVEIQTASSSWMTAGIVVDQPINFLTLDAEFISGSGAEGYLSVFWDDEAIGTIDERYVHSGAREYLFGIVNSEPGFHTLSFRLDPFTQVSSRVVLDDVRWGSFVTMLAGDFNRDGTVDIEDYGAWRSAFGTTVANPGDSADGNSDGIVNAADYIVWRKHFGASFESVGSNSIAVPEPSTGSFIVWFVGLIVTRATRITSRS